MFEDSRRRWWALYVLCSGVLMIVLDTTIVNVALPSIREDLEFTETSLVWVVNAYILTFGGFLLLGGRLGDLYGHRRVFLIGLIGFTAASVACGLAQSQAMLIAARALQGIGGAVVSAVALSLIMDLFTESTERAKAMGIYGFVCSAGGSIGVLLGGFLTTALNWHWIFLVNLPIGIAVYVATARLMPRDAVHEERVRVDWWGAITVTSALMLAVYAIVNGEILGWRSTAVLGMLGGAVALLVIFLVIESKVREPLMPLGLLRRRNIAVANIVAVLWAGGMFAWFFISALFMQLVLNYNPLQVGLSFLPANLIMAAFSLGLSAKIVLKFGFRLPLAFGLLTAALGLASFALAPVDGSFWVHVLPGMVLLGVGAGVAFNPLLMGAMSDASNEDSGLASGLVNTAFMMGGALGLAILASIAAMGTETLLGSGASQPEALNGGYRLAFIGGTIAAAVGAIIGGCFMRTRLGAATSAPAPHA